ncbi:MAG: RsmE family RNA methyltransferase [Mucinivorans sp.]
MHLFFTSQINSEFIILDDMQSHHAISVLRLQSGTEVYLTDGCGTMAQATIDKIVGKECILRVLSAQENYHQRPYKFYLAVAPTKNIDRYEWLLEKATELGVDRLTPLLCAHSERKVVKRDRSEKVVISALRQSLKAYMPQIDEMTPFNTYINTVEADQKYIAHCDPDKDKVELASVVRGGGSCVVLIGPEGDFSPQEVAQAHLAGFQSVALGSERLRTETAGLYATAMTSIKNCK